MSDNTDYKVADAAYATAPAAMDVSDHPDYKLPPAGWNGMKLPIGPLGAGTIDGRIKTKTPKPQYADDE